MEYFAITTDDKPGEGGRLGTRLKDAGINLLAMSAFPAEGRIQVDLVPEHPDDLRKAAKKLGLAVGEPKIAFLVQGSDRAGALAEIMGRLGNVNVNITAILAVGAGGNRYGSLIFVPQQDLDSAPRSLGAVTMATHHV